MSPFLCSPPLQPLSPWKHSPEPRSLKSHESHSIRFRGGKRGQEKGHDLSMEPWVALSGTVGARIQGP